jgi:hypothetical protein
MSNSNATLAFVAKHAPALTGGAYTLDVSQTIEGDTFEAHADFLVAGPRFHLDPGDIHSMFPPPSSVGDHAYVLPHIILRRSTLPWESGAMANTPWLALALFDDGEIKESGVKAIKDLGVHDATGTPLSANVAAGETENDTVSYITVSGALLTALLPSADDLQLLTHVRRAPDGTELAVVMGNRLPKAGSSSAMHLVSLESRYKDGVLSPATGDITLVSLATWRFTCDVGGPGLRQQMTALTIANAPPQVALRHRLRNGQRQVSWYRSPFSPTPAGLTDLPDVEHADGLLGVTDGQFDVTYAAAWELGRLLTLRNKHVASELYLWKCRHADNLRAVERQVLHHGTDHAALPPDLPATVADWFDALGLLKSVPFHYLIPDEGMLPRESIRFFTVDRLWLEQLQAGAFAVGHVAASTPAAHLPAAPVPSDQPLCGFLLRSSVVSQWPHLEIEASSELLADAVSEMTAKLTPVRREVLSPGILLCLFQGKRIQTLDFHQKPEALHSGFDVASGKVTKQLRDSTGIEQAQIDMAPWVPDGRRLRAAEFKTQLEGLKLGFATVTSAEFALAMIEGVDRVRFTAKLQRFI